MEIKINFAWFCYKLNLPKDLNFVELSRGDEK